MAPCSDLLEVNTAQSTKESQNVDNDNVGEDIEEGDAHNNHVWKMPSVTCSAVDMHFPHGNVR